MLAVMSRIVVCLVMLTQVAAVGQDLPVHSPEPAADLAATLIAGDPPPADRAPLPEYSWPAPVLAPGGSWSLQLLPDELIYRSYLAGVKESRMAAVWNYERDLGWIWDVALGGRVGLVRFGSEGEDRPNGWQIDFEGAAFPRLDLEHNWDVSSTDFRTGIPLTLGLGPFQAKLAYYHLCSHLADEYMIRHPDATRINYVRDAVVLGVSYDLTDDLRIYAESGWSFNTDGGAEPWEFQFGIDYSPRASRGLIGSPYLAVNAHLREELDFAGHVATQVGWQWRGGSGQLLRTGLQYFNGKTSQYEFLNEHEESVGWGVWYDF